MGEAGKSEQTEKWQVQPRHFYRTNPFSYFKKKNNSALTGRTCVQSQKTQYRESHRMKILTIFLT